MSEDMPQEFTREQFLEKDVHVTEGEVRAVNQNVYELERAFREQQPGELGPAHVVDELAKKGVTDEGRIQRVMKHVDLDAIEMGEDGQPARHAVQGQLIAVGRDMPELLTYRVGAGSGGSKRPVLKTEKPLTRDDLDNMGPDEINSRWGQVKAFLAGERG